MVVTKGNEMAPEEMDNREFVDWCRSQENVLDSAAWSRLNILAGNPGISRIDLRCDLATLRLDIADLRVQMEAERKRADKHSHVQSGSSPGSPGRQLGMEQARANSAESKVATLEAERDALRTQLHTKDVNAARAGEFIAALGYTGPLSAESGAAFRAQAQQENLLAVARERQMWINAVAIILERPSDVELIGLSDNPVRLALRPVAELEQKRADTEIARAGVRRDWERGHAQMKRAEAERDAERKRADKAGKSAATFEGALMLSSEECLRLSERITALKAERDALRKAVEAQRCSPNCRSQARYPFGAAARAAQDRTCNCWKSEILTPASALALAHEEGTDHGRKK